MRVGELRAIGLYVEPGQATAVVYRAGEPIASTTLVHEEMGAWLRLQSADLLSVVMPDATARAVGQGELEAAYWIGRHAAAWGKRTVRMTRRQVALRVAGPESGTRALLRTLVDRHGADTFWALDTLFALGAAIAGIDRRPR